MTLGNECDGVDLFSNVTSVIEDMTASKAEVRSMSGSGPSSLLLALARTENYGDYG